MASEVLTLTQELIARRSLTPDDAGCSALLQARLERAGFACQTLSAGGVSNLWARRGTARPLVCFAGHTDVVPTGPLEQWTSDPFTPTLRDGRLYGRGAADMKASLAAFTVAVERFTAAHPKHAGSIALLLTSDEEGPAVDGTVRVCEALKARGEALDYCIVGEPTCVSRLGDTIKNGRRGSLTGRLRVRGVQAHIAYPHLGENAVHLAAPALAELAATRWDEGNEYFPPTTWQVSNMNAGTGADNIIPGVADIRFNFRFAPVHGAASHETLQARVREILDRHGLRYELEWTLGAKPYLTGRGELVEAISGAIAAVTGTPPELSTTGGTSDGRFIADICPQVVEFGPVNASIHKIDESVGVDEVEQLPDIYEQTLARLLLK